MYTQEYMHTLQRTATHCNTTYVYKDNVESVHMNVYIYVLVKRAGGVGNRLQKNSQE